MPRGLCALLIVLGAILLPAHNSATRAQPVSKACPRPTLTQDPSEICCISGYVFFRGAIVDGAEVVVRAQDGNKVSTRTELDLDNPSLPPAYGVDLQMWLDVYPGQVITVTASYAGHSWSVAHVVRAGAQWVNLNQAPSDYDQDGKTDIAVFRPSDGTWYILRSVDRAMAAYQFGLAGDIPVPGDYDRDGTIDAAVFRPSDGIWYALRSSDGAVLEQHWGMEGDKPVPGDYDGDGKTDLAVFRPSDSTWYIRGSFDGTVQRVPWGLADDRPVPGDYDGDHKTDIAIFRPADNTWWIAASSSGNIIQTWGDNGDIPVPGDYDGDQRADLAVFRPDEGTWHISGFNTTVRLGQPGDHPDLPMPGDYDGDDRTDIALFRPNERTWYILRSSDDGNWSEVFGLADDIPITSPYPLN
jgi:hypothetical protein